MTNFNEPFDQDVLDEQDDAPAVKRRKHSRKARRWRIALEAFDYQQLLHEYGLNQGDLADD